MFVDVHDAGVLSQSEHDGASSVEWDPTGRYVVSATLTQFHKVWCSRSRFHEYHALISR